jgi:hypothetical protein
MSETFKAPENRSMISPGREWLMVETILKRFETADEVRNFEEGKFEIVRLGGVTVGRATYEPGWKWSVHVGPTVGAKVAKWNTLGW